MAKDNTTQLQALYRQVWDLQETICRLQRESALGRVDDHVLVDTSGPVRLSALFGDHRDLVLVHNMGSRCAYCTMWGDGLVGLVRHVETRAGLAMISPDAPEVQRAFADARGWPFRMVSSQGSALERLLGFEDEHGSRMPGYSTFTRDADGAIRHVASDFFGPGDSYNGAWHIFARLAGGTGDWHPKI